MAGPCGIGIPVLPAAAPGAVEKSEAGVSGRGIEGMDAPDAWASTPTPLAPTLGFCGCREPAGAVLCPQRGQNLAFSDIVAPQ
ncbi:hypothetical protein [Bifidobacterium sp. ESL0704]|uniref:hypothetical protein n=1 Tax=Bifidobacterium sp. ESL0704 TaxID=2983219 RepID=UPI0023F9AA88|nr:hypothetical protein [Bifidobacterium sp. ESL0704]WEV52822.1 hypothetical protein OZX64_08190 [Bifidobacterium sp. ESL0704]